RLIFDSDRAWLVAPCDPEAPSHGVKMQRTRPEFPGRYRIGDQVPTDPYTAAVFRTARTSPGAIVYGPESKHPLPPEQARRLGTQSRMVVALYPKNAPPYLFGVSQCSYARSWTAREEVLCQTIGRRLTDALTSLSMFHRLRESEKRYRHIFESLRVDRRVDLGGRPVARQGGDRRAAIGGRDRLPRVPDCAS